MEAFITKEKLEECAHEFDSNINESLNNIVAKYVPKNKHFSKSIQLTVRVLIAAGIYLIGYHALWTKFFTSMKLSIPSSLEMSWLEKDIAKVKKYGKEHTTTYKRKRKKKENRNLAKETKKRGDDIRRNYEYAPCVGMDKPRLVKKVKQSVNECKYAAFGCPGKNGHRTNRSKHCIFFGCSDAEIAEKINVETR